LGRRGRGGRRQLDAGGGVDDLDALVAQRRQPVVDLVRGDHVVAEVVVHLVVGEVALGLAHGDELLLLALALTAGVGPLGPRLGGLAVGFPVGLAVGPGGGGLVAAAIGGAGRRLTGRFLDGRGLAPRVTVVARGLVGLAVGLFGLLASVRLLPVL